MATLTPEHLLSRAACIIINCESPEEVQRLMQPNQIIWNLLQNQLDKQRQAREQAELSLGSGESGLQHLVNWLRLKLHPLVSTATLVAIIAACAPSPEDPTQPPATSRATPATPGPAPANTEAPTPPILATIIPTTPPQDLSSQARQALEEKLEDQAGIMSAELQGYGIDDFSAISQEVQIISTGVLSGTQEVSGQVESTGTTSIELIYYVVNEDLTLPVGTEEESIFADSILMIDPESEELVIADPPAQFATQDFIDENLFSNVEVGDLLSGEDENMQVYKPGEGWVAVEFVAEEVPSGGRELVEYITGHLEREGAVVRVGETNMFYSPSFPYTEEVVEYFDSMSSTEREEFFNRLFEYTQLTRELADRTLAAQWPEFDLEAEENQGQNAVNLLSGEWENFPDEVNSNNHTIIVLSTIDAPNPRNIVLAPGPDGTEISVNLPFNMYGPPDSRLVNVFATKDSEGNPHYLIVLCVEETDYDSIGVDPAEIPEREMRGVQSLIDKILSMTQYPIERIPNSDISTIDAPLSSPVDHLTGFLGGATPPSFHYFEIYNIPFEGRSDQEIADDILRALDPNADFPRRKSRFSRLQFIVWALFADRIDQLDYDEALRSMRERDVDPELIESFEREYNIEQLLVLGVYDYLQNEGLDHYLPDN